MAIIKCPECGHQISDQAPVCPSCGVEIAGNIIQCPQCGEVYFKNQQECPKCHYATNAQSTAQQAAPQGCATRPQTPAPKKKKNNTLLISFIIALAVCCVGLVIFNSKNSNNEQDAYEYAMNSSDPEVLQSYLDKYMDAPEAHRDSINAHLDRLKQFDQDWTNAVVSNSKVELQEYIENHPDSPHKAEALHKIDSLDWNTANSLNSADAYKSYLEDHPNGEHYDEANEFIKGLNSKTIQPEEKQMISSLFRHFFQSVNAKDEDGLTSTVNSLLTSFLGKPDATKSDVITFMHKIYKDDVTNMVWHLAGDYKIDKKEIGDEEYEYTVNFSATQDVTRTDASKSGTSKYHIKAKVNPDGKITEMNMTRVIE